MWIPPLYTFWGMFMNYKFIFANIGNIIDDGQSKNCIGISYIYNS